MFSPSWCAFVPPFADNVGWCIGAACCLTVGLLLRCCGCVAGGCGCCGGIERMSANHSLHLLSACHHLPCSSCIVGLQLSLQSKVVCQQCCAVAALKLPESVKSAERSLQQSVHGIGLRNGFGLCRSRAKSLSQRSHSLNTCMQVMILCVCASFGRLIFCTHLAYACPCIIVTAAQLPQQRSVYLGVYNLCCCSVLLCRFRTCCRAVAGGLCCVTASHNLLFLVTVDRAAVSAAAMLAPRCCADCALPC